MSMVVDSYRFGGSSTTLYDEILADGPFVYMRLNETSGTNANNEAGATDGTYSGSFSLNNTAIYSGGPVCFGATGTSGRTSWPGTSVPTCNALTLGLIFKPVDVTGTHHLISRDSDTGTRFFQFRAAGSNFNFIKTTGSVQTVSVAHGMSAGTAYIIHCTVSSGGSVKIYKNGSLLTTGSVTAANYGGSNATNINVANRNTHNEAINGDFFSEAFVIASDISAARILIHAQKAGFA